MIKVSVIISAYNIENYIGKCIESIMNQTLKEIEIIIVNDGSTDRTLNIINKYKKLDNRIIVIDKENKGVQSARNEGLRFASGESVLFVDGDDWLDKEALNHLFNRLDNDKLDIVCYGYYQEYEDGKVKKFKNKYIGLYDNDCFLSATLMNEVIPSLCCKLIRREFLTKNKIVFPEDIAFGEDLATTVRLALNFPKVLIIEQCYYYYFTRIDSVTNKITDKALDLFKAFNYIQDLLNENKYYEKFEEEFEFLRYYHLYFERVVGQTSFNKTHKKFYKICNSNDINNINNKYLDLFTETISFNLRVWLKLYSINYNLAILVISLWKSLFNIKEMWKNRR